MDTVLNGIKEFGIAVIIIAVLAFIFTYPVKIPIKQITIKIKHCGWRRALNKLILLIPLILSAAMWAIYINAFNVDGFNTTKLIYASMTSAFFAIVLYGLLGEIITSFLNPYEEGEGKELKDKLKKAITGGGSAIDKAVELIASDTGVNKNIVTKAFENLKKASGKKEKPPDENGAADSK